MKINKKGEFNSFIMIGITSLLMATVLLIGVLIPIMNSLISSNNFTGLNSVISSNIITIVLIGCFIFTGLLALQFSSDY